MFGVDYKSVTVFFLGNFYVEDSISNPLPFFTQG